VNSAAPALTRDKILGVSIRLLQQNGYSALGMREIAQHLNIKAPSLYHHFGSKEVLARHALEHYRKEQRERLQTLSARKTVAARLTGYAELFSQMLKDDARLCLYVVLSQERSLIPTPCRHELQRFVEQNVAWLEETLAGVTTRRGSRVALDSRATADMLFAAFEGFMLISLNGKAPAKDFLGRALHLLRVLGVLP
jgi:TetR/AcrR family transcriptional regulator, transcriptional repressor for nem operon